MHRCIRPSLLVLPLLVWCFKVPASPMVIFTTYPAAQYQPMVDAFTKDNPGITVKVINKKTPAMVNHILQSQKPEPDILWTSSPDAMALLQQHGMLKHFELPAKTYPENVRPNNERKFAYFAYSQFGFLSNRAYLEGAGLQPPESWEALTSLNWKQHIALSSPSRSGTNHLIIEQVLQHYGWKRGWAILQRLAGNLSVITARSFGVREGVMKGRFGTAPVVDFFYRTLVNREHFDFYQWPENTAIGAAIGIASTSIQPRSAERFITFTLSDKARPLLENKMGRIPAMPSEGKEQELETGQFDIALSANRYFLVNALFDQLVTLPLYDLQAFWEWYEEVKGAVSAHQPDLPPADHARMEEKLMRAYSLMTRVPLPERRANDPDFSGQFLYQTHKTRLQIEMEQTWRKDLHSRLDEARELLADITRAVNNTSPQTAAPSPAATEG
ncbi:ABC transporter substrate-binding protein [Parasalinivibrio latis]|uniref:ABC transporter substrate-binding protein n=1 Tax=Parasalinivibrio latis TaxID=2952610 RepID=UPI0030E4CF1A